MRWSLLPALILLLLPATARAQVLLGDLNGDGRVDDADQAWFVPSYGSSYPETSYDAAADLNDDGCVDVLDLGLYGGMSGASGGRVDIRAPELLVTLNDIPENMSDLLVVPPEGFQITIQFDGSGGSVIDPGSVSIRSSQDMLGIRARGELASLFEIGGSGAVLEIAAGADLARTSHYLSVSVDDAAGNQSFQSYGFAVRDFGGEGPPFEDLKTVFLDFEQDRSLGPGVDLLEDMRELGLSWSGAPELEADMRDRVVSQILTYVHPFYGRNADGSAGKDSANVVFVDTEPAGSSTRLCVGGESGFGPDLLGVSILDVNDALKDTDACTLASAFGVFPAAIDDLWGSDPTFQTAFAPLDPDLGGTPVGENPLDPIVLAAGFDPSTATREQRRRHAAIGAALEAFSGTVATAIAHETGHLLGLVAHGPTPGGLYGGNTAADNDHNVTPDGLTPSENFLMNDGASFSFAEVSNTGGGSFPVFRALSWAYLRDRVVLDPKVKGLYPAPAVTGVDPGSAAYGTGDSIIVTITGHDFLAGAAVQLSTPGDPAPLPVLDLVWVDTQTIIGTVYAPVAAPGVYDLRVVNPDGQVAELASALVVQ